MVCLFCTENGGTSCTVSFNSGTFNVDRNGNGDCIVFNGNNNCVVFDGDGDCVISDGNSNCVVFDANSNCVVLDGIDDMSFDGGIVFNGCSRFLFLGLAESFEGAP